MKFVGLVNAGEAWQSQVECWATVHAIGGVGLDRAAAATGKSALVTGCQVGKLTASINAVPDIRPGGEIRADGRKTKI